MTTACMTLLHIPIYIINQLCAHASKALLHCPFTAGILCQLNDHKHKLPVSLSQQLSLAGKNYPSK